MLQCKCLRMVHNDAVCNKSFLNWTSSDRCLFRFLCSCFVAFFSIVVAALVLLLRTASLYVLLLYRHRCGFRRSVPVDDYLPFQLLIVRLNSALFYKISTRFIFYFFFSRFFVLAVDSSLHHFFSLTMLSIRAQHLYTWYVCVHGSNTQTFTRCAVLWDF